MKHILAIVFALLLSVAATAQEIVVIGQVLSAEDASPLAAANVWFAGTKIGTTTNDEGFFLLRSPEPQKALTVSVVGYKKRNIRLDLGKDQMVEVLMQEDASLLDEIIVMPSQDDALLLMQRVRENRHKNNPRNVVNVATTRQRTMYSNVTNIKGRAFRRRLFKDLSSGAIAQTDTNYSLPMYGMRQTEHLTILPDSTATTVADSREEAVELLDAPNWRQLLESYLPTVDPYRPYITLLGSNLLSPTATNARTYYNIYIADSLATPSGKKYIVSFRPKRDEGLLLRGTMAIDSATAAITAVNWQTPSYIPINFLHNYSYQYSATALDSIFFPQKEQQFIDLQLTPSPGKHATSIGTILSNSYQYSDTRLLSDTLTRRPAASLTDSVAAEGIEAIWAGIDSINQSRIQRLASWVTDIVLNQYLHIWKIDVGPLLNLFHYNRYEGASPRLSLRSGERFSRHFSFGGYYGYGFKDLQHKYGGQIQWLFGRQHRHYLAFHYDHKVERYGYDDLLLYDENRVHDLDHLFSSLEQIHRYPTLALHKRMKLVYRYEQPGIRFNTDLRAEYIYGNNFLPYIQNGVMVDRLSMVALKADIRLSWQQRTMDEYFHRIYLGTRYPVVRFAAEVGGLTVGQQALLYGSFNIYAHQNVPVGFGRLRWAVQASAIAGRVPWPLLSITHTSRGSYFHDTDFALLNQMELTSDLFVAAHLRYQTRGYIFGYIPGVKRLGIREDLIFKIGYGRLRPVHNTVLALPSLMQPWNNMPYMEAGFGFSNILYLGDISFVWRITHRDNPNAIKFGVHWRIGLDF